MDIVRLGTGRMIRFVPGHCKKLVYATTVERGWEPAPEVRRIAASGLRRLA